MNLATPKAALKLLAAALLLAQALGRDLIELAREMLDALGRIREN